MSGRHSFFDVPDSVSSGLGRLSGRQEVTLFSRKATTVTESTVAGQETQTVVVLISAPSSSSRSQQSKIRPRKWQTCCNSHWDGCRKAQKTTSNQPLAIAAAKIISTVFSLLFFKATVWQLAAEIIPTRSIRLNQRQWIPLGWFEGEQKTLTDFFIPQC